MLLSFILCVFCNKFKFTDYNFAYYSFTTHFSSYYTISL